MEFKLRIYNPCLTPDDIVKDLKHVSKITKKDTVSCNVYKQHGKYDISTVVRHFGSWNRALKLSGLRITRIYGTPKTELMLNLKQIWITLERQPLRREVTPPLSEYSWKVYNRVYGSWTKALQEFIQWVKRYRKHDIKSPFLDINAARKNKAPRRTINVALRYKVMQRDGYKCVLCGDSPAYGNDVRLHIDHITPYSKGGETILSNLQTLCAPCNLGKGNKT